MLDPAGPRHELRVFENAAGRRRIDHAAVLEHAHDLLLGGPGRFRLQVDVGGRARFAGDECDGILKPRNDGARDLRVGTDERLAGGQHDAGRLLAADNLPRADHLMNLVAVAQRRNERRRGHIAGDRPAGEQGRHGVRMRHAHQQIVHAAMLTGPEDLLCRHPHQERLRRGRRRHRNAILIAEIGE